MSTADTERRAKRLTRCAEPGCSETLQLLPHRTSRGIEWRCYKHAPAEAKQRAMTAPHHRDVPPSPDDGRMFGPRVLVGKAPDNGYVSADGRREVVPRGALPWWWCYGKQPVFVKGAVYLNPNGGANALQAISEEEAHRQALAIELGQVDPAALGYSRSKLRRARRGRRQRG